jgi:predicted helicase
MFGARSAPKQLSITGRRIRDRRLVAMSSLPQLEASLRRLGEERARGDAFEAAVLPWLTIEPDLGLRAAWRWADWPGRVGRGLPGSDDGIDLVGEDTDGELVAIQVKFRSDPERPIGREEAQKALSYPGVFDRYLLVSNAWGRTRRRVRLAGTL